MLYFPIMNYTGGDLEDVRTMMSHPRPPVRCWGHCGTLCDASFPTSTLLPGAGIAPGGGLLPAAGARADAENGRWGSSIGACSNLATLGM